VGRPGIIKLLFNGVRRALGLLPPGWSLTILPDDVFLVSFPKSGNTWTRFLVGNLISPDQPATFSNIPVLVPDPLGTPTRVFDRMQRPRIIKSHECFDPRYPRVIYIVRDPRDVVVSQYHYHRKIREIADDMPIEAFVEKFLAGKTWTCGSWGQHVVTWLGTSEGNPEFLMLRYEDILEDASRELRKVVAFLALQTSATQIAMAVERSTAVRMRQLEKSEGCDRMIGRESRRDIMFVRTAVSGGWRRDLPMPMVNKIEAAWGPVMKHLGYELARQPSSSCHDHAELGTEVGPRMAGLR
jgi:hypothetical protein